MRSLVSLAVLGLVTACGSRPPVGELRYRPQPPVWRVNDRDPLPKPPAERPYYRSLYHTDGFVVRRMTRAMEKHPHSFAADINSLGEVPDSTWFTNRIGVRQLSLDEVRNGPNHQPGPFAQMPWKIKKSKSGGTALGFVFEDSTGVQYLLKFDEPARPEMETAAHIIVHRILWACGYNVPEDYVGYVRREDLKVSSKATRPGPDGTKVPMSEEDLTQALAKVAHTPDGRIRVLVSRYLPGKLLGPYAREGVRKDDPNDVIPHEQRRSLRGQFAIFAWLNHTDLQEDNTLDTFENGHVIHYLVDFGKALGVMGYGMNWQTVGYTYRFDFGIALKSLVTLGLWQRPWEEVHDPKLPGVGMYEAEHYEPGAWRPNSIYWPLEDKDRFDAFWGAKILMRFTREQLAAIVDEAKLSDPRSAAYVLDTLVARQKKTARYWFSKVAPVDHAAIVGQPSTGALLCFDDLSLTYGLDNARTLYSLTMFDRDGRRTSTTRWIEAGANGRTCVRGIVPSAAKDGYTIAHVVVHRGGGKLPPVNIHLAYRSDGVFDVIGLRRE